MLRGTGKVVGNFRYLHISALSSLGESVSHISKDIIKQFPSDAWNVAKIHLKDEENISLLYYPDFYEIAFPALSESYKYIAAQKRFTKRNYSKLNPPILHRKELLLCKEDIRYQQFVELTKTLEANGAYQEMHKFGTKIKWEERLKKMQIQVIGHEVFAHGIKLNHD